MNHTITSEDLATYLRVAEQLKQLRENSIGLIQQAMAEEHLNQTELAHKWGVSVSTICNVLKGRNRKLSYPLLLRIVGGVKPTGGLIQPDSVQGNIQ